MFNLSVDTFSKMKNLRLLKVFSVSNCDDLKYLSNELRLLDWTGYPLRFLPSNFHPDNLVALLLPYSHIEQLWKGNRPLLKLKMINLKGSQTLIKTPDFTTAPKLEALIMEGCTRLVDVHPSIGPLFKLKMINLKGSQNLIKTPDFTTAPKLETLIMEGCTRLVDVHPSIGVLKSLKLLNLRDCKSLRSLPTKIGMESLETLILSGCSNLARFPEIDGKMEHLKTLHLSGCFKVEYLPENLQQAESLEELDLSGTAIKEPSSFISQLKNLKVSSFSGCKGPSYKSRPNLPFHFKVIQGRRTNPIAPVLPLLSGLSSLRRLNLGHCNLCEGDIPPDISGLSSLIRLNLSGNNFISIPASLTRLSKLEVLNLSNCNMCTLGEADIHGLSSLSSLNLGGNNFNTSPLALTQLCRLNFLRLSNCKMLKSLPELPTDVLIDGFTSLEVIARPSKVRNLVDGDYNTIAINCFKLAENINALTLLKKYLKASANSTKKFTIFMPGSEIPEWFSQQKNDSSIKIPLRKDSQWIGVASCCIFISNDASRHVEDISCDAFISCRNSEQASCDGSIFRGRNRRQIDGSCWLVGKSSNEPIMKDHLFLCYWSRDKLYPISMEDKYGNCETNNLWATDCLDQKWDELEVSFAHPFEGCVKVKKCGVRIVHEKDLEEIKELQCHNTQFSPNFEHIHQHSAHNDGSTDSTSHIKRKANIYDEA
ncbi:hypothetical protein Gotur_030710 [Gossypium turneri]